MDKTLRVLAVCTLATLPSFPTHAITGGTSARGKDGLRRAVVRIENTLGEVCSGVLIAPNVVLTAAHCVATPSSYRAVVLNANYRPHPIPVTAILKHPSFVTGTTPRDQPGTDLALVRLAQDAPPDMAPAEIAHDRAVNAETELYIAGFGTSSYRNERSVRTLRIAPLVALATNHPPNNLIMAADRRNRARLPGASACLGDSGGPALMKTGQGFAVSGIISWAGSARLARSVTPCGGTTMITPIAPHRMWIIRGVRELQ